MSNENFIKGRIAEKIVKDLFIEAGFKVINYGYEYILPKLADKNNLIGGNAAAFIRHQPDFVVIDENNEAFFIEVKYRKYGKIKKEHMFRYPCCYVVFLTKDFILAQELDKIYKYGDNFDLLNRFEPFKKIPTNLIYKYVKVVRRKLGEETFKGQLVEGFAEKVVGKRFRTNITPPIIEGGNLTPTGWERLESIPSWIIKKSKTRRAKRVGKDTLEINGTHYRYRMTKGYDSVLRGFRKKK